MQTDNSPIIAIATAPGRGGIGVIRISGQDLTPLLKVFYPTKPPVPRQAHFTRFKNPAGETLDEGLVLYFPGPHSYTGEDVLELQGHGGPAVLQSVLQSCIEFGRDIGLRLAEPGEFTRRAFLNSKMDLAQAEAVADLIDATSTAAAKGAVNSLSGEFSAKIQQLSADIVHLRMLVEATLDFPEEEIEFLEKYQVRGTLEEITNQLTETLAVSQRGKILREGLYIVLAGKPNTGKSSLLNALAGDEIAIVTPIAGTTRDRVVEQIHLAGIPLHIVDTAGLRETEDEVEKIGIERSWAEIRKADILIHMREPEEQDFSAVENIKAMLPSRVPVLNVVNKIDLLDPQERDRLAAQDGHDNGRNILISAKKGTNLDALRQAILECAGMQNHNETPWIARERHVNALKNSLEHLEMAREHASHNDELLDLFAEELRLAHESLTSITGEFTSDDLLGEIFSTFCIGK